MKNIKQLTPKEIERIRVDAPVRKKLACESHLWFFTLYMNKHLEFAFAPFHYEMFAMTENPELVLMNILAFRSSAKSTLMTLSLPMWAMTGKLKKKFILIVSQTQQQARLHLVNLKQELEENELLKRDIGPFQEITDEWSSSSLVIPRYDTRITAVSMEQSVRGLRHHEHRPDLIILDDIENSESVRTKEGRDKTFSWVMSEIIPAGNEKTTIVCVGNYLHNDAFQMRLFELGEDRPHWAHKKFPLLDENNQPTWTARFPDQAAIEKLHQRTADETAWQREYLLRPVVTSQQVIHPDWLQFYDAFPPLTQSHLWFAATGVDLAITQKDSSDYTAMVSAYVFEKDSESTVYILPQIVNKKLTFPETIELIKQIDASLAPGKTTYTYVEKVGYQEAVIQQLAEDGVEVIGVTVSGDKRARLSYTTPSIKNGQVLFPKHGAEDLIDQLTDSGTLSHDDLADAFSLLINQVMVEINKPQPNIRWM